MNSSIKPVMTIGYAEVVSFPEISSVEVHARVDTGAQTSSIWASYSGIEDGKLNAILFGPGHPAYTGKRITFDEYRQTVVASSNGQAEQRYKVKMLVDVLGRKIRARFTLADRSSQTYPVLIGRNILRGKFVVDVKLGNALTSAEKARSQELQSKIQERK